MKIVNTTPEVLKHQIKEAIAKAVADYRTDYPNDTGFTRKCTLNMETMVNLCYYSQPIWRLSFREVLLGASFSLA